jgi:hypothetical protein
LADVTHLYTGTSFGPEGASSGSTFESVQGVAVDQTSGDVFVLDGVAGKIYKFDEDGEPVDFSGLGANVIEGLGGGGSDENLAVEKEIAVAPAGAPGGTAGDIYIANNGGSFKIYAPSGQELPEVEAGGETCGIANDPTGHIYAGIYSRTILEYTPSANPPVATDRTAENTEVNVGLCNVAADSSGNVYAANYGQGLFKLEGLSDTTPTEIDPAANSVGIDPSNGDVYADRREEVAQYSASGALLGSFGAGQLTHSRGVAVSVTAERVYAGSSTTVKVFGAPALTPAVQTGEATSVTSASARLNGTVDPEGVMLEECKFEFKLAETSEPFTSVPCAESVGSIGNGSTPVAVHADISGLVGSTKYSFRIVAKNENGATMGAGKTFKTLGPAVGGLSISAISDHGATFAAEVNPNSQETSYVFEYVSEEEFQVSGFANAKSVPAGGENIGSGNGAVEVEQKVNDLSLEATYRVRVVATNEGGVSTSADRDFHTYGLYAPGLADGRVYEQATPVDKNGGDAQGQEFLLRTAPNGSAVTYFVTGGGSAEGGSQELPVYAAIRSADGWRSRGFLPGAIHGERAIVTGWSEDLTRDYVLLWNSGTPATFYEQDVASGDLTEIVGGLTEAGGGEPRRGALYADESADGSTILFESRSALTSGAIEGMWNLYAWDRTSGSISLVDKLTDGATPPDGAFAGSYNWPSFEPEEGGVNAKFYTRDLNTLSDDGTKAFFTTGSDNQLYVRMGIGSSNPSTVRVSASQKTNGSGPGGADPNGPQKAIFLEATPDGHYVFFASHEELTNDATTGTGDEGKDLYRYDIETGQLIDLATDPSEERGADVLGMLGSSSDGTHAYFAASGSLAPGAPSGGCCYIYLWHEGEISYVARVNGNTSEGAANWLPTSFVQGGMPMRTARVSEDGKTLSFLSSDSPTAYDSKGLKEFYRYNINEGLECVSCNPTGNPPMGNATLQDFEPGLLSPISPAPALIRNLSADGKRVFFESPDKLVASDTNGESNCPIVRLGVRSCQDVYEWEAKGTGSCESETQNGGCLYLISTGESPEPSYFADASSNGDDAYFLTRQSLVRQDTDQLLDVYGARVGGGIAAQNEAPRAPCEGEACRSATPVPQSSQSAGSARFSGPGDPRPNHKKKRHSRRHHHKKKANKHTKTRTHR